MSHSFQHAVRSWVGQAVTEPFFFFVRFIVHYSTHPNSFLTATYLSLFSACRFVWVKSLTRTKKQKKWKSVKVLILVATWMAKRNYSNVVHLPSSCNIRGNCKGRKMIAFLLSWWWMIVVGTEMKIRLADFFSFEASFLATIKSREENVL